MEMVNRVSAFRNYQNFSDVITERPKPVSENGEPIKIDEIKVTALRLRRHGDHSDWRKRGRHQVVRYIHSPALFIQCESNFETEKKTWMDL